MSKCSVVLFVLVESHRGVSELIGFPRVATVVMFVKLVVEEVDGGEWLACLPSPTAARTVEDEEDSSSFLSDVRSSFGSGGWSVLFPSSLPISYST